MTSTLFAIDIPLSTYCFTAFWLYRAACRHDVGTVRLVGMAFASGVSLFLAYTAKQSALLIGALFAAEALWQPRDTWRASLVSTATLGLLLGAYLGWQWRRFGDPLYDVRLVSSVARFEPHTWANQLDYYRMLFLPDAYGGFFAGWYPHALVLLAVVFALRVRTAGKWLLYCMLALVGLSSVPARYEDGQWVLLVTHIFRYLCFASIPLCLALTGYLRELVRWRPSVGIAFIAALLGWTIVQAVDLSWPSRDAFGEQRRANAVILSMFPDELVWSDFGFLGRIMSFAPDHRETARIREIRSENPVAQARELANVTEGVVVSGGGRLPWYGCITCALSIAAFTPPPTWTLVTMYGAAENGPNRRESLRVWRVSPAVPQANALLAERVDDPSRVALLRELVASGADAVAAEVGRRLAEEPLQPGGSIAYLTGLAYWRMGRLATARAYWTRALGGTLSPAEARDILRAAIVRGTPDDVDIVPGWVAGVRARFPGELDPAMEAARPWLAEARPLLHAARYAEAATILRAIRDREGATRARRQQAHYLVALSLLRAGAFDAGAQEAESYRKSYGEDDAWSIELRYREAEARLAVDGDRARQMLADLVARAPRSIWSAEARRWLATQPAPAFPN
jgi:hypothetical protein